MAVKYYNWECVVWEESLNRVGGVDKLIEFGVKGFISPLQDDDGGKNHYHWILCYQRQKSREMVMEEIKEAGLDGCINMVIPVKDLPTRARYLCHLDELHKTHYDPDLVIAIGGLDYHEYVNTPRDKKRIDKNLFDIIRKYNCTSYSQLVRYCCYVVPEYYSQVTGKCGFWSAYMRSLANDSCSLQMEYDINEKIGVKNET